MLVGKCGNKVDDQKVFYEQNKLYKFPYHHIPHFDSRGIGCNTKNLHWGFEYLCSLKDMKLTVEALEPKSVLDVGCGDGAMISALNSSIKRRVGIDLSKRAIDFAKGFSPDAEFYNMDATDLAEEFDVVMSVEVLEHIPDEQMASFIQTLEKRTRPGGYIYISVPSINIPLNKKHYRHYDIDLLQREIRSADVNCIMVEARYFYSTTWLDYLYNRLRDNRFFTGEIHPLRRYLWKKIWERAQCADEKNGHHVIVLLKKL